MAIDSKELYVQNGAMKLIAFDGISGSGKTSLISEVRRLFGLSPHDFYPIDRWTASTWVMHQLFQKKLDFEYINNHMQQIMPVGIVWCDAPAELCWNRIKARQLDMSMEEPLIQSAFLFDKYFSSVCSVPYLQVDTTRDFRECAEEIAEWIRQL